MDQTFGASSELKPPLREHPLYAQGNALMEAGRWDEAFETFRLLHGIYPDEGEVEQLLEKVQVRVALSSYHRKPRAKSKKHLNARQIIITTAVVCFAIVILYIGYEVWAKPLISREYRLRQVATLRKQADEAITTGNFEQAQQALRQLQEILPEDPETATDLQKVESVTELSTLYEEARTLMDNNQWDDAIEVLTEIQTLDPQYRNLNRLLQTATEAQLKNRQFQAAEEAISQADWSVAISQLQTLQQNDLTFRFAEIQSKLFESHLRYGQMLLEETGTEVGKVEEALAQFEKALALRPIDDEALRERQLVEQYLAALGSTDRADTIDSLQTIYSEKPDYAGGAVAEYLYQFIMERAESSLVTGDKPAAITDYQLAAQLLVDDPSEALQKLAELEAN